MNDIVAVNAGIQRCAHDKENPYLMVSVDVTRDSNLTVEDLGFLTILLDHPNNFKFNVAYLVKRCKLSKEKTRKLLSRLIELGYVIANQVRNSGKFLGMVYSVFEKPLKLLKAAVPALPKPAAGEKTVHGKTEDGNSDTNKYDDGISTKINKINKNVCMSLEEDKNLILKTTDQVFINNLLIRGMARITDQSVLDAYLAEFNKNSSKYADLPFVKRVANFTLFIKRCMTNSKANESKAQNKTQKKCDGVKSANQAFFWAKNLCADQEFISKFCNLGEEREEFESRIRKNLFKENHFTDYKPFLIKNALIFS